MRSRDSNLCTLSRLPAKKLYAFLLLFVSGSLNADAVFTQSGEHISGDMEITADMGITLGSNLFHSFSSFHVLANESATFTGPESIQNILARVTGSNLTLIDGLLKSEIVDANFFLLNPNGVVFGPGAQLQVDGAFHASTARELKFSNGERLLISDSGSSSLNIGEPSAFGFADAAAPISFEGARLLSDAPLPEDQSSLSAFSITGGDITVNNSRVFFADSDIRLVSVSDPVSIPVAFDSQFVLPAGVDGGAITISNDVSYTVRNDIENIEVDIGNSGTEAGKLTFIADTMNMDKAFIFSDTWGEEKGGGIDIYLQDKLQIKNGSRITAEAMSGNGDGGNIIVRAPNVFLDGTSSTITAGTRSSGNGGNISIVSDSIELANESTFSTSAYSTGNGGKIDLDAGRLVLNSGAKINALTVWSGDGGDIEITAAESVTLDGLNYLFSDATSISVSAESTFAPNGGDSGNIRINTPALSISRAGILSLSRFWDSGPAGSITLETDVLNTYADGVVSVSTASMFDAGVIDIDAASINHRGILRASTSGSGDAGDITLSGDDMMLSGGIEAFTVAGGAGGSITLNLDELVIDTGQIDIRTEASGAAGALTINVDNLSMLNSAEINSSVFTEATGNGGVINLNLNNLLSVDSSTITVSTDGIGTDGGGNAGLIFIDAGDIRVINGGSIEAATSASGRGGAISITSGTTELASGGKITTESTGSGDAGAVSIVSVQALTLDGADSAIDSRTTASGLGGSLSASALNIELKNGASITTASEGTRFAGDIDLVSARNLDILGGRVRTDSNQSGGGNITVDAVDRLYLLNGELTASARGESRGDDGGNVNIDPVFILLNDSTIVAQAVGGDGGIIQLESEVFLSDRDSLISATSELGNDGEVRITAPDNSVTGILGVLQAELYEAPRLLDIPCAASAFRERSSLIVEPTNEDMVAPDDIDSSHRETCSP